jgi:hypothetical protein
VDAGPDVALVDLTAPPKRIWRRLRAPAETGQTIGENANVTYPSPTLSEAFFASIWKWPQFSPLAFGAAPWHLLFMTGNAIQSALAQITAETDPALKHLQMASLVSALLRERSVELVVVGGSPIESYTEGAYVSVRRWQPRL